MLLLLDILSQQYEANWYASAVEERQAYSFVVFCVCIHVHVYRCMCMGANHHF